MVSYFTCNTLIYLEANYRLVGEYSEQYSEKYRRCTFLSSTFSHRRWKGKYFHSILISIRIEMTIWQMKSETDADVDMRHEEKRTLQQIEEDRAHNRERMQKRRAARSKERSSKLQTTSANQSNTTESVFASPLTVPQLLTGNGEPILHTMENNVIVNTPTSVHLQPSQVLQMHNDYWYSHIKCVLNMVPGQWATPIQGAGRVVMVDFHFWHQVPLLPTLQFPFYNTSTHRQVLQQ